jgi:hypothetical protein
VYNNLSYSNPPATCTELVEVSRWVRGFLGAFGKYGARYTVISIILYFLFSKDRIERP